MRPGLGTERFCIASKNRGIGPIEWHGSSRFGCGQGGNSNWWLFWQISIQNQPMSIMFSFIYFFTLRTHSNLDLNFDVKSSINKLHDCQPISPVWPLHEDQWDPHISGQRNGASTGYQVETNSMHHGFMHSLPVHGHVQAVPAAWQYRKTTSASARNRTGQEKCQNSSTSFIWTTHGSTTSKHGLQLPQASFPECWGQRGQNWETNLR